jgi:FlaA1/EpsC-like NDP-sugar epimerase
VNILEILNRRESLFRGDLLKYEQELNDIVANSKFLVVGGGGSIGQAVSKELFNRRAKTLHIVDLNENYLVEFVRDVRSSDLDAPEDFDVFAIDCGAEYFRDFMAQGQYDFVLNLSAMKHVRSENSGFSMLRMLETNILNSVYIHELCDEIGVQKYFAVSTDKAANPVNFMGATKRAMEMCLMANAYVTPVSGARFANVAFSNGSLLEGFTRRIEKRQPISVPSDVSRYFITDTEAGIICLFSSLLGKNNEIYFPKNMAEIQLTDFVTIATNFLASRGVELVACHSEEEAKHQLRKLDLEKYWPVNIFVSDTAGEKSFEEFYVKNEKLIEKEFFDLGAIKCDSQTTSEEILKLINNIKTIDPGSRNLRSSLLGIMKEFVPTFKHSDGNKFLNERM